MKHCLLFLSLTLAVYANAFSQSVNFSTLGNGTTYSLSSLAAVAGNAFQYQNNTYYLNGEVTVSANDVLAVSENATIFCAPDARLIFTGVAQFNSPEQLLLISSDTVNQDNFAIGIYVNGTSASNSYFHHVDIRFCCGLKITEAANVVVSDCNFYKNKYSYSHGMGALMINSCNPQIINSSFSFNDRCAIASPANGEANPMIYGCSLYHNDAVNGNYPQINLGPGSQNDTIYILNNTIVGNATNSGAVSVATLMGGYVNAAINYNVISNNRYGIAGTGNNITMYVNDNQLINNNLETNPMNGGSGINLYATTLTSKVIASQNYITGSLWGVTLVGTAQGNFGCLIPGADYNIGHNRIVANGNGGVLYNFYNNTANNISAENNYWGYDTEVECGNTIFDSQDNPALGTVDYSPIWIIPQGMPGDANGDGEVNVSDVMITVSYLMNNNPDAFVFDNADVNNDDIIDVRDVMLIVGIIFQYD